MPRIPRLWAPVALWMVVLFVASEQVTLPGIPPGWDKVLHAGAYGVLGVLSLRAFHGGMNGLRLWPTVFAVLLTISYGLADEWHQSWVPGRRPSFLDWLADLAGASCAVAFVGLLSRLRSSSRRPGSARGAR